jgi:tetratricopeptide (TPR) repeat protein
MGEVWPRERAHFYLEYIRGLWNAIRTADTEKKSLAEIQDRLSFEKDFAFVKNLQAYKDHGDDWFRPQHRMHVRVWYLQNKNLASEIIKRAGSDSVSASLTKIRELRDSGGDVYFDESSINGLGYYFMNTGKMPEAIEVLGLNVEVFPESANTYDSLAEAYMKNGDNENAIKNYKKSLALNPDNENARTMLEQLENI